MNFTKNRRGELRSPEYKAAFSRRANSSFAASRRSYKLKGDDNILSVIIPSFNEGENIKRTADVLSTILNGANITHELIFIDDGSVDATWREISSLSEAKESIRGVRFSRNFGKEAAIFAGLRKAKGDAAVVIDCDLQHPPELIPKMHKMWQNGAEVVEAVKRSRGRENPLYKLFAKLFYRTMQSVNNGNVNLERASDYRLLDRKVVDALCEMPERITFFRALSTWVGFRREYAEFDVLPRKHGKSKWNFCKLFSFALSNLTSFTNFPMHLMTAAGSIFFIFAIVLGANTLWHYIGGTSAEGFTTVILLLLIIGAFIMLGLGIIGYYISKIYEEIKFRPRYIISDDTEKTEKPQ